MRTDSLDAIPDLSITGIIYHGVARAQPQPDRRSDYIPIISRDVAARSKRGARQLRRRVIISLRARRRRHGTLLGQHAATRIHEPRSPASFGGPVSPKLAGCHRRRLGISVFATVD